MADPVHYNWYQSGTVLGGQSMAGFRAPVSRKSTSVWGLPLSPLTFEQELEKRMDKIFAPILKELELIKEELKKEEVEIAQEVAGELETPATSQGGQDLEKEGVQVNELELEEGKSSSDSMRSESGKETSNLNCVANLQNLGGSKSAGGGDFTGGFIGGGSGCFAGKYGVDGRSMVEVTLHWEPGGGDFALLGPETSSGDAGGCGGGPNISVLVDIKSERRACMTLVDAAEDVEVGGTPMKMSVRTTGRKGDGIYVSCGSGDGQVVDSGVSGGGQLGDKRDGTGGERNCVGGVFSSELLQHSTTSEKLLVEATRGIFVFGIQKKEILSWHDDEISSNVMSQGAHSIHQIWLANEGQNYTCSIEKGYQTKPDFTFIYYCKPSYVLGPTFLKIGPNFILKFQSIFPYNTLLYNLLSHHPLLYCPTLQSIKEAKQSGPSSLHLKAFFNIFLKLLKLQFSISHNHSKTKFHHYDLLNSQKTATISCIHKQVTTVTIATHLEDKVDLWVAGSGGGKETRKECGGSSNFDNNYDVDVLGSSQQLWEESCRSQTRRREEFMTEDSDTSDFCGPDFLAGKFCGLGVCSDRFEKFVGGLRMVEVWYQKLPSYFWLLRAFKLILVPCAEVQQDGPAHLGKNCKNHRPICCDFKRWFNHWILRGLLHWYLDYINSPCTPSVDNLVLVCVGMGKDLLPQCLGWAHYYSNPGIQLWQLFPLHCYVLLATENVRAELERYSIFNDPFMVPEKLRGEYVRHVLVPRSTYKCIEVIIAAQYESWYTEEAVALSILLLRTLCTIGPSSTQLNHKDVYGKRGGIPKFQLSTSFEVKWELHSSAEEDGSRLNKYLARSLYLRMQLTFNSSSPADNLISGLPIPSLIKVEADYYPP